VPTRFTSGTRAADILDFRPKAKYPPCANILAMNRLAANSIVSPPRRFILLPEETVGGSSQGPRIRRYRLTSVGQGADRRRGLGADIAMARMAREFGRVGRL
jgi:hypothetical protein